MTSPSKIFGGALLTMLLYLSNERFCFSPKELISKRVLISQLVEKEFVQPFYPSLLDDRAFCLLCSAV